eukprot:g17129.t1
MVANGLDEGMTAMTKGNTVVTMVDTLIGELSDVFGILLKGFFAALFPPFSALVGLLFSGPFLWNLRQGMKQYARSKSADIYNSIEVQLKKVLKKWREQDGPPLKAIFWQFTVENAAFRKVSDVLKMGVPSEPTKGSMLDKVKGKLEQLPNKIRDLLGHVKAVGPDDSGKNNAEEDGGKVEVVEPHHKAETTTTMGRVLKRAQNRVTTIFLRMGSVVLSKYYHSPGKLLFPNLVGVFSGLISNAVAAVLSVVIGPIGMFATPVVDGILNKKLVAFFETQPLNGQCAAYEQESWNGQGERNKVAAPPDSQAFFASSTPKKTVAVADEDNASMPKETAVAERSDFRCCKPKHEGDVSKRELELELDLMPNTNSENCDAVQGEPFLRNLKCQGGKVPTAVPQPHQAETDSGQHKWPSMFANHFAGEKGGESVHTRPDLGAGGPPRMGGGVRDHYTS